MAPEIVRLDAISIIKFAVQDLGISLPAKSSVLDFGCGIGYQVQALLEMDFDAYGVDIFEYWGRDYDTYWLDGAAPNPPYADRLKTASHDPYRIPYEDASFDFCISDQVMEHVEDYQATFLEL